MEVKPIQDGDRVLISHRGIGIVVEPHGNSIKVTNAGDGSTTASYRSNVDRNAFLFSSAQPTDRNEDFDLIF